MKRCDWKQKKIWNALSSKPVPITHSNKTFQITLLATFLYPLFQYQEYRVSYLTVKNEGNSFLSLLTNNYTFKSWQKNITKFQADGRIQSFTMCHEISCRNYVLWNVWPWKVQVSPSCNYSLGFWEVYNSAAEMMPAWTEHAVLGTTLNKTWIFFFQICS